MHANFSIKGFVSRVEVKPPNGNKKGYGRITVATGEAGFEFFVEPQEVESGYYFQGQQVTVDGTMSKRGYDVDLRPDSIVVAEQQKSKAS